VQVHVLAQALAPGVQHAGHAQLSTQSLNTRFWPRNGHSKQDFRPIFRPFSHVINRIAWSDPLVGPYLHHCREKDKELPFVALNCAAVPADLIEAELFGAERGAFTGAVSSRQGLFEQAGAGTLFSDEAGEMPLDMQTKLLRAAQEKSIRHVGGRRSITVEARLTWATNCDLKARVADGRFREDLYFRMSTVQVKSRRCGRGRRTSSGSPTSSWRPSPEKTDIISACHPLLKSTCKRRAGRATCESCVRRWNGPPSSMNPVYWSRKASNRRSCRDRLLRSKAGDCASISAIASAGMFARHWTAAAGA